MSSMVPDDAPKPRGSHLRKWADFNGYGFNLHAEKGKAGQFIGKVDPDSPAESAGLKPGDRIVEVNDVNIGNENHQQVVGRIKAGYNGSLDETKLLVVDSEADQYYKSKKLVIRGDMPNVVGLATPPIRGGETIVTVSNGHIAEPEPEPVVTETVTTVTETVITEAQVPYDRTPEDEVTYDEAEPVMNFQIDDHEDDNKDEAEPVMNFEIDDHEDDNKENIQREAETYEQVEFIPPPPPAHSVSDEEDEGHTVVIQTHDVEDDDETADPTTYDEPQPTEDEVVAQFNMATDEKENSEYDEEENNNYEEVEVNKEPEPEPVLTETEVAVAAVAVAAAVEETRREPTPPPREPTPPPREPTPPPREPTPPPVVVQQTETTVVTTTTTVNGISEPEPAPEPKGPVDPATGLELNVSVAEMKERLSSRRKRDSRNAALNFKDKYEMFQRL